MSSWHSYPSIYALGHRAVAGLTDREVLIEEKVDGSQFSFGVIDGVLRVRSKGAEMFVDAPEKMFTAGVATARELAPLLNPDWTYRGEYLAKPKHNVLAYERTPRAHVIIFDINRGHEDYLTYDEKAAEAARIGLEVVPKLFEGVVQGPEHFRTFLANTSVLGGQLIEGVVVKQRNVTLYDERKKPLIGKFVSESFKEVHSGEWRKENPSSNDIIARLSEKYTTPARWQKAVQRLDEVGKIEGSPRDIGPILKEVWPDIKKECEDEIKEALWKWAEQHLCRASTRGLPEWYKGELLKKQFETVDV